MRASTVSLLAAGVLTVFLTSGHSSAGVAPSPIVTIAADVGVAVTATGDVYTLAEGFKGNIFGGSPPSGRPVAVVGGSGYPLTFYLDTGFYVSATTQPGLWTFDCCQDFLGRLNPAPPAGSRIAAVGGSTRVG